TYLLGTAGGLGTSTKIIPWIVANNANNGSVNPSVFATYSSTGGIRALIAGEFDTVLTGTATRNVVVGNANLGTNVLQTVNSISMSTGSNVNVGSGSILSVTSGGVMFVGTNGANGTIGIPGDAAAGTLAFGSAEGVVWSLAQNTNAIGAVITGTGGLTKAGLGTLTLAGNNLYGGKTVVSAGTLRIGNGVQGSNVGTGDVDVAVGATLRISATDSIANVATLTLDQHGIVNGKLIVDAALIEQVGSLVLGGAMQADGYYGSLSAVAANPLFTVTSNDVYFSGTGLLHVVAVPEPASLGLLLSASLLLVKRRRATDASLE
ncbi:MAG TPA: autotransporter-associated beta strand repeat-containing protein, partial [Roseimicrobium sp.]|nr:autotransporter-associated beta strand repeat-containing protein [Roseimicrobium sp.]